MWCTWCSVVRYVLHSEGQCGVRGVVWCGRYVIVRGSVVYVV